MRINALILPPLRIVKQPQVLPSADSSSTPFVFAAWCVLRCSTY